LTPKGHAEQYFIADFSDTWIPQWLLWALGVSIPVLDHLIECLCGSSKT